MIIVSQQAYTGAYSIRSGQSPSSTRSTLDGQGVMTKITAQYTPPSGSLPLANHLWEA